MESTYALLTTLGIILAASALVVTSVLLRKRRWREMAARLGLSHASEGGSRHRVDTLTGELPDIGAVRATIISRGDRDGSLGSVMELSVGSRLPAIAESVASALVGRDGKEWTYRERGWRYAGTTSAVAHTEATIREGLALARTTLVAERMSPELRGALADPAALRGQRGSLAWKEAQAFVRSDVEPAVALRVASLLRDPELLRELAQRDGPIAAEAFDDLIRLAPASDEAARALDERIEQRADLAPRLLERLAIALGRRSHPRADEVLIELLGNADPAVRIAAAAALREVGTVVAVPALVKAKDAASGALRDAASGALRSVASEAIDAIQGRTRRAGGARAGGLALADTAEAGALSIAADPDLR